ncbi:BamA/TamA family outer membrane protein [Enterobacteriaceae bacterium LUAb1]
MMPLFVMLWTAMPLNAKSSLLPSQVQVDRWLAALGADGQFDAHKGIDWGILPGPFYTPELGAGIGVAVVGMYRPEGTGVNSQNSTLSLSGYVSSNGAFGFGIKNYNFFADDHWRLFINGTINDTPLYYWGTGFAAGRNNAHKQQYTAQEFAIHPDLLYRIAPNTWLGAGWAFSSFHADNIKDRQKGTLERETAGNAVTSSGASLSLRWDSRDFVPNPRHGMLMKLTYTRYSPELGSNRDSDFDLFETRYALYHAINDKSTLAWEIAGQFTQGDVPWNMLPSLGGDQHMRGYYEGRYRDRNVASTQLEWRHKLSWRHGVVGWLGTGTMGPAFSTLGDHRWLPSAGVGYRFEFKPRMNVRLDYGIGKASSGFYFQVGEAF